MTGPGIHPPRFPKGSRVKFKNSARQLKGEPEIGTGYVRDTNLQLSGEWLYEIVASGGRRVGWLDSKNVRSYDGES